MTTTMTPRKAAVVDLPAIIELLEQAGLPLVELGRTNLWVAEQVALGTRRAVGVVGLQVSGPVGLLRSLAVQEPLRGQGLGSRLLDFAVQEGIRSGLTELYALTETADDWLVERGFVSASRQDAPVALASFAEYREVCGPSATLLLRSLK